VSFRHLPAGIVHGSPRRGLDEGKESLLSSSKTFDESILQGGDIVWVDSRPGRKDDMVAPAIVVADERGVAKDCQLDQTWLQSVRFPGGDPAVFEAEYGPLAEMIRQQTGCVAYDCLLDPRDPGRRVVFEVWETSEDHAAHLADPAYIEILARGTRDWGISDLRAHVWNRAEGHSYFEMDRTDTPIPGRDQMNQLVASFGRRPPIDSGPKIV
jgi:quinol monooxygenase YgiN